jgi:hypothetical protein
MAIQTLRIRNVDCVTSRVAVHIGIVDVDDRGPPARRVAVPLPC